LWDFKIIVPVMEQENNSRRKFLKAGVITGIAAAGV
jgi:hypothetical protein